jgi:hypothetical protein
MMQEMIHLANQGRVAYGLPNGFAKGPGTTSAWDIQPGERTWGIMAVGHLPVCPSGVHHGDGSVIIAMIAVGMMKVSGDQVVDVIAVGNRLVAAGGAMNMSGFMATAVVARGAGSRIVLTDGNRMLGRTTVFLMA